MPSFVFYLFLNSTFAFSSLKKFQPHHFPWALCRQSTLNNQHILTGIMALCSPPPHRWKPSSQWVRHIHTVFKLTPTSTDLCPVLPPEHQRHNLKSLTLIHPGWQIGFWRRRTVKSRIDGGWKKDDNTQACLLLSQEKWKNHKSTSHLPGARSRPKPRHYRKEGMEQETHRVPLWYIWTKALYYCNCCSY